MTEHVLITGAAGFVGGAVAHAFARQGAIVSGIGLGQPRNLPMLSAYTEASITVEALERHGVRPDIVVHCASGASVGASMMDPAQDFISSVVSTEQLAEFLRRRCPSARLVFASSAAVYGMGHDGLIHENDSAGPISPYGLHKQLCEDLLRFYARNYGLNVAIVRLFSIYGEGLRKQLPWDACGKLLAGNLTFSGTGDEVRDWLHVSDAAELLRVASQKASTQAPLCNGATGQGTSVRAVLSELASALSVAGAPQFNGHAREGDPRRLVGSRACAEQWGWTPRIAWQDGIRAYAGWYRINARD